MEKDNAEIDEQFQEYKHKFIAQSDLLRTELSDKVKHLQLVLKKANEEGFLKERLIGATSNEIKNLHDLLTYVSNDTNLVKSYNEKLHDKIKII